MDLKILIQIGLILATVVSGWAVMRKTVAGLEESLREEKKTSKENDVKMFNRLDQVEQRTALTEQTLKIHAGMLAPDRLAEFQSREADFKARTDERITVIRRDIDEMRSKT